jgi:hypothetical protein
MAAKLEDKMEKNQARTESVQKEVNAKMGMYVMYV